MPPEMREKYGELSETNSKLQKVIDKLQEELDIITKEKTMLQQQIYANPVSIFEFTSSLRAYLHNEVLYAYVCFFTVETRSDKIGAKTARIR